MSFRSLFLTLVISSCATGSVLAEPADFSSCVGRNKQMQDGTSDCAEEICRWEVCKDQVIYRTGATGAASESPLAYKKDPGAWGEALAVCQPYEQMMRSCQAQQVVPQRANEFCKTGSDEDLDYMKTKLGEIAVERRKVMTKLKAKLERYNAQVSEVEALKTLIASEQAEARSDAMLAKQDSEYGGVAYSKWVASGRAAALDARVAEVNGKVSDLQADKATIDRMQATVKRLKERYTYVARDLLDGQHDCAAAMSALQ